MSNNPVVVTITCHKIDPVSMWFQCPYCKSSYTKKGKARRNGFPVMHTHPSEGNPFNRIQYHASKCYNFLQPDVARHFKIVIDGTTIRVDFPEFPQKGSDGE